MNQQAQAIGLRILFAGIALSACGYVSARGPSEPVSIHARSTEAKIRATVLEHTPLGTSKESVLAFIHDRLRHKGEPEFSKFGALKRNYGPNRLDEWIGTSGITELEVGYYGEWQYLFLIKTNVYPSWAFDENDRLVDVIVYKETNGP